MIIPLQRSSQSANHECLAICPRVAGLEICTRVALDLGPTHFAGKIWMGKLARTGTSGSSLQNCKGVGTNLKSNWSQRWSKAQPAPKILPALSICFSRDSRAIDVRSTSDSSCPMRCIRDPLRLARGADPTQRFRLQQRRRRVPGSNPQGRYRDCRWQPHTRQQGRWYQRIYWRFELIGLKIY